ncbi:MAG: hypothetical protein QNJ61_13960 [Desulfobacterales bacterium]|nr:hypothetical protein [Desulfobacterales bacterium]
MTPQSSFMIVAVIRDGQIAPLRELLATMTNDPGQADPDNRLVPFGRFDRLHFARFVIIEATTAREIEAFGVTPRPWQPALTFFGDLDGDADSFLAELAAKAGPGLKTIFAFCEGFSPEGTNLLEWMQAHNIEPAVNYVNWVGRTVRQVHEEAALHDCLAAYLKANVDTIGRDNPRALRQKLLSHVEIEKHAGRLRLTPPAPTPLGWQIRNLLHKLGVPLILLLASPLFLIIAPFFAIRLRMLERSDPELFIRPDRQHIRDMAAQEDHDVTNQYNVFGDVKPGLFRLLTFKFLLLVTGYAARHIFNRGFLARIRTIHFARWVFMDDNHRVFFASNYDGSHESYMDDFINKVGWGLNLTFSNGVGYPRTTWLIKEGAYREMPFKYTQRRHQLGSEVWYKAYQGLTAFELSRNSRIRQGVETYPTRDAEIREWLSLI